MHQEGVVGGFALADDFRNLRASGERAAVNVEGRRPVVVTVVPRDGRPEQVLVARKRVWSADATRGRTIEHDGGDVGTSWPEHLLLTYNHAGPIHLPVTHPRGV